MPHAVILKQLRALRAATSIVLATTLLAGCGTPATEGTSPFGWTRDGVHAGATADDFDLERHEVSGQDVVIVARGGAALRLTVVEADVVRVWVESSGAFERPPSASVDEAALGRAPFSVAESDDAIELRTAALTVRVGRHPIRVDFYRPDGTTPIALQPESGGLGWSLDKQSPWAVHRLGEREHFFGLGQDNDAYLGNLDRRGSVRDMWTGQQIAQGHVTADIPIPFFMSTGDAGGGYGMFFDDSHRARFDMGASASDLHTWSSDGGELVYYFFAGPRFADILDRYTALTGRPSMPPLWALGFIQSKCTYFNWDEIDDVVTTMRNKQIPLDVMVIDYDWPEQYQNFRWNARWNGESPARLAGYEAQGVKFLISNSGPMIRKDSSNYQDALLRGLLASDGQGHPVTCGHYGGDLMDFTAPGMKDWLWPQMSHLYDEGIDGWWLDLTEPEGEPEQTVYQGGPRGLIHNVYSLLATRAYFEMQKAYAPNTRPFILTRTGFSGIQRYGAAIWSGDIFSDYQTLQAHAPEALNATLSGIPLWTNDSGGFLEGLYRDDLAEHGRLYERWLQFSAFMPITRAHHVGPSAPYMFGEDVERSTRNILERRYRLLPYIYAYVHATHETGLPLTRALVLEDQDDPQTYVEKDEFLFGHELLVAPVLHEGATSRMVYFPEGTWVDYDLGVEYQGGRRYRVSAPRDRIPMAVRKGAIIPMAPPMLNTHERAWDPITLDVYPEGRTRFMMYRDDGETTDFETLQRFTETEITSDAHPDRSVTLTIAESNKLFTPRAYEATVHLASVPTRVTAHGHALSSVASTEAYTHVGEGWFWDGARRVLALKFDTGEATTHTVEINVDGTVLEPLTPPVVEEDGSDTEAPPHVIVHTSAPLFLSSAHHPRTHRS